MLNLLSINISGSLTCYLITTYQWLQSPDTRDWLTQGIKRQNQITTNIWSTGPFAVVSSIVFKTETIWEGNRRYDWFEPASQIDVATTPVFTTQWRCSQSILIPGQRDNIWTFFGNIFRIWNQTNYNCIMYGQQVKLWRNESFWGENRRVGKRLLHVCWQQSISQASIILICNNTVKWRYNSQRRCRQSLM